MTHSSKFLLVALATFLSVSVLAVEALAKPDKKEPRAENPILVVSIPNLTGITPEPDPVERVTEIRILVSTEEEEIPTVEVVKDIVLPADVTETPPEATAPVNGSEPRYRYCGDGELDKDLGEVCDDGNSNSGDGCYECGFESGWGFWGDESY